MIVNIDNELERLKNPPDLTPKYCPFVVTIYRDKRSRNPIFVRRKTLQEALAFVEEVTGLSAIRYVTNGLPGQLYAFTGTHADAYEDMAQYKPARIRPESIAVTK